jgi:hypothetical protein
MQLGDLPGPRCGGSGASPPERRTRSSELRFIGACPSEFHGGLHAPFAPRRPPRPTQDHCSPAGCQRPPVRPGKNRLPNREGDRGRQGRGRPAGPLPGPIGVCRPAANHPADPHASDNLWECPATTLPLEAHRSRPSAQLKQSGHRPIEPVARSRPHDGVTTQVEPWSAVANLG